MFRLIKLALYVSIGYMLYEFFQGLRMTEGGGGGAQRRSQQSRGASTREPSAGGPNLTGPAKGRRVNVDLDEHGMGGHTQVVGRGVVR